MPWLTVAQNVAFGLNIKHTPPKQRDELVISIWILWLDQIP